MVEEGLRFATLIRVSTEKQERKGESLRVQKGQVSSSVEAMRGHVTREYAGQEHATSGYERKILEQLLNDACQEPRLFDAVIVTEPSRWARDNVANETGLDLLRDHGIRFFALGIEFDLYDPTARHFLATQANSNQLFAALMKQKSVNSCIQKAKDYGVPTAGRIPYGRKYDKKTNTWDIDEEKARAIAEIAQRYLAGESLPRLAQEFGINHSFLHRTLRHRCGASYTISWNVESLNRKDSAQIPIPPLLDEKTIEAIGRKAEANRTHRHGKPKHDYLLSGFVFCGGCGYLLSGQMNARGSRYYRHHPKSRGKRRQCDFAPAPYVSADALELAVIEELHTTFGNPVAFEQAVNSLRPNSEKIRSLQAQREELSQNLERIESGRDRIIDLAAKLLIDDDEASAKLRQLNEEKSRIQADISRLNCQIEEMPSTSEIRKAGSRLAKRWPQKVSFRRHMLLQEANEFENMTWDEQRKLVEAVFSGDSPDGRPMGLYIYPIEGQQKHRQKKWRFQLLGHVPNFAHLRDRMDSNLLEDFQCVTQYASR